MKNIHLLNFYFFTLFWFSHGDGYCVEFRAGKWVREFSFGYRKFLRRDNLS